MPPETGPDLPLESRTREYLQVVARGSDRATSRSENAAGVRGVLLVRRSLRYIRSITAAMPCPPPMHIVMRP